MTSLGQSYIQTEVGKQSVYKNVHGIRMDPYPYPCPVLPSRVAVAELLRPAAPRDYDFDLDSGWFPPCPADVAELVPTAAPGEDRYDLIDWLRRLAWSLFFNICFGAPACLS